MALISLLIITENFLLEPVLLTKTAEPFEFDLKQDRIGIFWRSRCAEGIRIDNITFQSDPSGPAAGIVTHAEQRLHYLVLVEIVTQASKNLPVEAGLPGKRNIACR